MVVHGAMDGLARPLREPHPLQNFQRDGLPTHRKGDPIDLERECSQKPLPCPVCPKEIEQ